MNNPKQLYRINAGIMNWQLEFKDIDNICDLCRKLVQFIFKMSILPNLDNPKSTFLTTNLCNNVFCGNLQKHNFFDLF